MGIRDTDKGYRDLVRRVYTIAAPKIDVGILESDADKAYSKGATVLEVATWNEFGAGHVPERSFLRGWFDENEAKARLALVKILQAVVLGKYTKEAALELLGQRFVAEIQRRIAQGIPPPNAASTVRRKGSSTPLIDTGQLRSSISYKVRDR